MPVIALILAMGFAFIAFLHAYWGVGGTWGAQAALPKKEDGSLLFRPGRFACFVVAAGLLGFAYLPLAQVGWVPSLLGAKMNTQVLAGVAVIFILRAIGDFQYVGFFRRVKRTDFGRMDAVLYTPLCVVFALALGALVGFSF